MQFPFSSFSVHIQHRGNINLPLILMGRMGNSNFHEGKILTFIRPKLGNLQCHPGQKSVPKMWQGRVLQ